MEDKYIIKYENCLEDAHYVRDTVFIKEQKFELDKDEIDLVARHIVVYDNEKPIATARTFLHTDGTYHIGRVAVIKEYRGKGIGRITMIGLHEILAEKGVNKVYLSSQTSAKEFYKTLGYIEFGEEYYDEHCLHISMCKQLI